MSDYNLPDVLGQWPTEAEIRRRSQGQPLPDWAIDRFTLTPSADIGRQDRHDD